MLLFFDVSVHKFWERFWEFWVKRKFCFAVSFGGGAVSQHHQDKDNNNKDTKITLSHNIYTFTQTHTLIYIHIQLHATFNEKKKETTHSLRIKAAHFNIFVYFIFVIFILTFIFFISRWDEWLERFELSVTAKSLTKHGSQNVAWRSKKGHDR